MGEWNWLDSTLVLVVAASAAVAALKGFVRELISLAAVVVGLIVAAVAYARVAPWFEELTSSRQVARGASFLLLFLSTLLIGALLSGLAKKLVRKGQLERADFLLGAVFGLFRGVVVDCVLIMTLVAFAIKPQAVQRSVLAPYAVIGAHVVALVMPSELKEQFRTRLEEWRPALVHKDRKTTHK